MGFNILGKDMAINSHIRICTKMDWTYMEILLLSSVFTT